MVFANGGPPNPSDLVLDGAMFVTNHLNLFQAPSCEHSVRPTPAPPPPPLVLDLVLKVLCCAILAAAPARPPAKRAASRYATN